MNDSIKDYFEYEVSQVKTPPMPTFKKKKTIKPWENFLLTALALTSMVIVYLPTSYGSAIRDVDVSNKARVKLQGDFSRVILGINFYFNEKTGEI